MLFLPNFDYLRRNLEKNTYTNFLKKSFFKPKSPLNYKKMSKNQYDFRIQHPKNGQNRPREENFALSPPPLLNLQ